VLLDALGTLVALVPPWPALARELRVRHGIEISHEQAVDAMRAEMAYYREHCHEARDERTLAGLRRRCADVVAESIGGSVAGLDRGELTETLLGAIGFLPYPDAAPTLEALRRDGVPAVVVSNWDVSLHDVLDRTGLGHLLAGVLTSAEFGAAKPSPSIFTAALAIADVPAEAAIHVGDSFEEDVLGAVAAGIEPILIVRSDDELLSVSAKRPDPELLDGVRTIASLAELVRAAA
jgi:putative hydrolase of the HAD superfamily